jgi:hypothetical protein
MSPTRQHCVRSFVNLAQDYYIEEFEAQVTVAPTVEEL